MGGHQVLVVSDDRPQQSCCVVAASATGDVACLSGFVSVFVLGGALVEVGGVLVSRPRVIAT
jgi:hypothetical protein